MWFMSSLFAHHSHHQGSLLPQLHWNDPLPSEWTSAHTRFNVTAAHLHTDQFYGLSLGGEGSSSCSGFTWSVRVSENDWHETTHPISCSGSRWSLSDTPSMWMCACVWCDDISDDVSLSLCPRACVSAWDSDWCHVSVWKLSHLLLLGWFGADGALLLLFIIQIQQSRAGCRFTQLCSVCLHLAHVSDWF